MEAIEKLRGVAIAAVEHVAMANYASRETEALKMIDDCVDSIRAECVVRQAASSGDEICGCGGKIKSYGIAGEKYCEYCDKSF